MGHGVVVALEKGMKDAIIRLLQLPEMVHQLREQGVTEIFFLPKVDFPDLMNE